MFGVPWAGAIPRCAPGHRQRVSERTRKISPDEAVIIRRRVSAGELQAKVADEFGVSFQTISEICRGKRRFDPEIEVIQ